MIWLFNISVWLLFTRIWQQGMTREDKAGTAGAVLGVPVMIDKSPGVDEVLRDIAARSILDTELADVADIVALTCAEETVSVAPALK